jgi:hypothetical protein
MNKPVEPGFYRMLRGGPLETVADFCRLRVLMNVSESKLSNRRDPRLQTGKMFDFATFQHENLNNMKKAKREPEPPLMHGSNPS